MARKSNSKGVNVFIVFIALILGILGGFVGVTYSTLPETEELIVTEEVFYSYTDSTVSSDPVALSENELSIHFLELGNKYTGDCTYIKYGDIDILIDCGSKSNSISTVSNYLNQYVTDGILEYVFVTHAHTDHFAGFATTPNGKVKSIFDLYECKNIIDFGKGTDSTTTTYNNYIINRDNELAETPGSKHYDASAIEKGHNLEFYSDDNALKIEVLFNEYSYNKNKGTGKAKTENDYSVCTLFTFGEKNFLFTGDLESEGESYLVDNNPSIQEANLPNGVELFKAGHHGSKTSSTEKLLSNIRPKRVCICCCAGSPEYTKTQANQFPTQEFINRVSKYTTEVYVTTMCINWEKDEFASLNGNIILVAIKETIPNDIKMHFSNSDTQLKDTDWFTQNNRTWGS